MALHFEDVFLCRMSIFYSARISPFLHFDVPNFSHCHSLRSRVGRQQMTTLADKGKCVIVVTLEGEVHVQTSGGHCDPLSVFLPQEQLICDRARQRRPICPWAWLHAWMHMAVQILDELVCSNICNRRSESVSIPTNVSLLNSPRHTVHQRAANRCSGERANRHVGKPILDVDKFAQQSHLQIGWIQRKHPKVRLHNEVPVLVRVIRCLRAHQDRRQSRGVVPATLSLPERKSNTSTSHSVEDHSSCCCTNPSLSR